MDAKITKKRLAQMLSYDWVKIVAFVVCAILLWTLIFQMTATRIKPSQQFRVYNHYANESLGDEFYNVYKKLAKDGALSYEVIEMNVTDLTRSEGEHISVLDGAMRTDDGDVIFVPNVGDKSYKTETDGVVSYKYTYVETFVGRYFPYLYNLDENDENGYFNKLRKYLNEFYLNGYKDETSFDEEKVKTEFRKRVKKNGDKRFKKAEEIERGAQLEVDRIQKYRAALIEFEEYVQSGVVTFTEITLENNGQVYASGTLGLNICPDVSKTGELKKQVSYLDENEVSTAKDMNVFFFNFDGVEDSFEFESLIYVNQVIQKALEETAAKNASSAQ